MPGVKIVVFNSPFRGQIRISDEPFSRILKHMERRITTSTQPATKPAPSLKLRDFRFLKELS